AHGLGQVPVGRHRVLVHPGDPALLGRNLLEERRGGQHRRRSAPGPEPREDEPRRGRGGEPQEGTAGERARRSRRVHGSYRAATSRVAFVVSAGLVPTITSKTPGSTS